jgi:simple sugar transport system permease protein
MTVPAIPSGVTWAQRVVRTAGRQAALLAIATLALAGLLAATGFAVGPALGAMWRGAAGSPDAVLSATLVRAIPLLLAGLGIALAFRAGVFNIGADGQLLAGATAATVVGLALSGAGIAAPVAALTAAALAGGAWAAGPAWLRRRFGTLEVISTIMFNFLALHLVSYLVRGPLQEPTRVYPQSSVLPESARLPVLLEGSRLHAGFLVATLLAAGVAVMLRHSAAGFRLRAVGANPTAAASAGRIDVASVQTRALLASGALAGLAGGSEVLGVTFALYENLSPGYGYTAIAVALLADLRPLAVVWSSMLLGGLAAGAAAMQRDAGVPAGAAAVSEAVLVLALLAGYALLARDSRRLPRLTTGTLSSRTADGRA